MKNTYKKQHAARMQDTLQALPSASSEQLREFVRQFYAKTPVADFERLAPGHAVALASSAFAFMENRKGGDPKIRIFKPKKSEHGYDSKYWAIELLNDDMPFLVDSLSAELNRLGVSLREIIHPIFEVMRDRNGKLEKLMIEGGGNPGARDESLIHFEISSLPEGMTEKTLKDALEDVLAHIRVAVADWPLVMKKTEENIRSLASLSSHFGKEEIAEAESFLRWLITKNFIFLGYGEYRFFDEKGNESLSLVESSRLGVFKIDDSSESRRKGAVMPRELRHFLFDPKLVEITKSSRRSRVHRMVPMDYIGIKRFDKEGRVIGEARILGLFTSNVYYQSADMIPLLRQKIVHVMKRADFDPVSHDGKALKAILEFLPRDEVLQMSNDELFETSMGILALESRPGVRVFVREDAFKRFVSLMVFVPRERFSTDLRRQIQGVVEKAYKGTTSTFSTQITEAPMARLHLIIRTAPGDIPPVEIADIEQAIARRAYLWSDLLLEALTARHGDPATEKLHRTYEHAFSQSYINRYDTGAAVYDIQKIEDALASGQPTFDLFKNRAEADGILHLKLYNTQEAIALSDILPIIENAGFRVLEEHPFTVTLPGRPQPARIRDFTLSAPEGLALEAVKQPLEDALLRVWSREMENDRFNALVARAGLHWRQVTVLRAYARYLKQIGFASGPHAIAQAMAANPAIAASLTALFEARFDPAAKNREAKQAELGKTLERQLTDVSNATHDRLFRRYAEVIMATLRTNHWQPDRPVLSFKFDSKAVPELPSPRPHAEIFVYSPRVEGIHLRGGKVARGGLRWSDRGEDFRTEVLGLMKAQMVKNSVIVPVGSKGGFVLKQPPAAGTREALMEEGIACYKLYLSGLLDLTDNIVKGKIVPPKNLVRHDDDDPYLVVAADKGTASFSDIANGVSKEYGFWLGDAFASGGSAGYDHKAMGITARGGWVSVARHFLEMDIDIAKKDFTAVGIGDMSGDVFGNGMLLSDHIRLVAAFDHRHIFIDPTPDAKSSFAERKRLFKLLRSSWKDYDAKLISKGGGVYERSAKSIALSKEAQAALGVSKSSMTPDELVRAVLLAPVDLLWNGGIGTYVKAEEESHEQVGDRANNAVRVNGKDLRCKVVGEGGNLGFTQKGRIEYARAGGRINTDAIDNSAGVDCSDHEVNIKIALQRELASGKLSLPRRDELLEAMTDEVAALVLNDNILQTQAITVAEQQGAFLLEQQADLMHALEREGLLDRAIEFLPSDKQLLELKAAKKGLTRPELAVLLAYSKMSLYRHLLASSLPDEAYFLSDLRRYFPKPMQDRYKEALEKHPLKREIIATVVTNSLINRAGITFCFSLSDDLNVSVRDIAVAYAVVRDAFGLRDLWRDIESASASVNVSVQADMHVAINRLVDRVTRWLLRNRKLPLDTVALGCEIIPEVAALMKQRASLFSPSVQMEASLLRTRLMDNAVSEALADRIAGLDAMGSSMDIIAVATKQGKPSVAVGKLHFALGEELGIIWLRRAAEMVVPASNWERLALQALASDIDDEHRRLTDAALRHKEGLKGWLKKHENGAARFARFLSELRDTGVPDLARLTVALKNLRMI